MNVVISHVHFYNFCICCYQKPDLYIGNVVPDPNSQFELYDRVVNVRESYTVPLGLSGTIIALHRSKAEDQDTLYDVVFDEQFPGGLSLNCSENRGYRLPKSALINKSHGQREFEHKAGKSGDLFQQMRSNVRQNPDVSQKQFPQHSAFVPCPSGNSDSAMYLQPNPYMYQTPYNKMYLYQQPPQRPPFPPSLPAMVTQQSRNFMPSYANEKSKSNIMQQVPQPQNVSSKQGSSTQKKPDNRQAPKIDCDYLKKILKITPNQVTKPDQKQLKVEDIFTHAKNKPLAPIQPKQESNIPNSVKLLSYYQSNGLGCPHYSYFDLPDKTIQSQLINPLNGKVVCGKPSIDKTEACENAAGEVLKMMENLPPTAPQMPLIPQPPLNWCYQQNQIPTRDQQISTRFDTTPNLNLHVNSVIVSPFVPLQAVRTHRNKNSNTTRSYYFKQNIHGMATNTGDHVNGNNRMSKPSTESTSTSQKPLRKKKMRIAANFSNKFGE